MNKSIRRQIRWFSYPDSTSPIARQEFEQLPNHGRAALVEALRRYQRGAERRAEIKRLAHPSGYPERMLKRKKLNLNEINVLRRKYNE